MRLAVGVEIERTAECNIAGHRTERRCLDCDVLFPYKGRHVDEPDFSGVFTAPLHECLNNPARRVDTDARFGYLTLNPSQLDRCRRQRNDTVPAVVAVPFV